MVRRSLLILALLAVGVVAWWRTRAEPPHSKPISTEAPPLAERSIEPELEELDEGDSLLSATAVSTTREVASARPETEIEHLRWVEGRVIIPAGTPADERVEVIADGLETKTRGPFRATIGPDGAFRLPIPADASRRSLSLEAKYLYLPHLVVIEPDEPDTSVELRPSLGGCVQGRLVGVSEARELHTLKVDLDPVAGSDSTSPRAAGPPVVVGPGAGFGSTSQRAADPPVVVGLGAGFEVRGASVGDHLVEVRLRGHVQLASPRVTVRAGSTIEVVVELAPSARVAGTVVDRQGSLVAGVPVVWTRDGKPGGTDRTGFKGTFRFEDLAPGEISVGVIKSDQGVIPPFKLALEAGQSIVDLKLVLSPGARVSGRVLDPDGLPRLGARVTLSRDLTDPQSPNVPSEASSDTDWNGRFEFAGLAPAKYELRAREGNLNRDSSPETANREWVVVTTADASIDDVELVLPRNGRVIGRVVGPDGRGVPSIDVVARGAGWVTLAPSRSDEEGRFTITDLPLGDASMTIKSTDRRLVVPTRTLVRRDEEAEIELHLVEGTLLRFASSFPETVFEPRWVVARDREGRSWELREVPEDEFDPVRGYGPLPQGSYDLEGWDMEGKRWRASVVLRGEPEMRVMMEVAP